MPSKTRSKGAPQAVGKWLVVDTDLAAASRELAKYKSKPIRWSEKAPSSAKFTVGYVLSEHAKPLVAIKVLGAVAVAHSDRAPVPKPGSEQEHLVKWIINPSIRQSVNPINPRHPTRRAYMPQARRRLVGAFRALRSQLQT